MTRDKILLIQRFYPNYREGLFDRLARNENFKLICHRKDYGKIKTPADINSKPYLERTLSIRIIKDFVLYPFLFFSLMRISPQVIVVEGGKNTINNLAVFLYCRLFKRRYIVWDLGKDHLAGEKISGLKKMYYNLQVFILKRAAKIYTYNKINIPYFKNILPAKEVIALGNTVDTEKIEQLKNHSAETDDIPKSITGKEIVLLYVGALNEKKKVHEISSIIKDIPNLGLIIVGDGDEKYKAHLFETLEGIEYVFLGYKSLDQLSPYYTAADLVLLPGLGGLTIPQSYMFEVPVLCSQADGTEKEIVINGETGYIFNNPQEARSFLGQTNKRELELMGKKGYDFVSENFSIQNYYDKFYNSI